MTRVWLPIALMREMAAAAERHRPNEDGGVVVGYWSRMYTEAVVTHVVRAGPSAEHWTTGLVPDADYQQWELDRIFALTHGSSYYLGDWHSHPGMGAVPSRTDRRTLRRIASDRDAGAPRPLMIILGEDEVSWTPECWQAIFGVLGRFGPISVQTVDLRVG